MLTRNLWWWRPLARDGRRKVSEHKVCAHIIESGGDDGACGECYGAVVAALSSAEEGAREAEARIASVVKFCGEPVRVTGTGRDSEVADALRRLLAHVAALLENKGDTKP